MDCHSQLGTLLVDYCTQEDWRGFTDMQREAVASIAFIACRDRLAADLKHLIPMGVKQHQLDEIHTITLLPKLKVASLTERSWFEPIDNLIEKVTAQLINGAPHTLVWGNSSPQREESTGNIVEHFKRFGSIESLC